MGDNELLIIFVFGLVMGGIGVFLFTKGETVGICEDMIDINEYQTVSASAQFFKNGLANCEERLSINSGSVCHPPGKELTEEIKSYSSSYDCIDNGKSMSMSIIPGSCFNYYDAPFNMIEIGHVIVFKGPVRTDIHGTIYDSQAFVHRVIGFSTDGYLITRGDNNNVENLELVSEDSYMGIVDELSLEAQCA